MAKGVLIFYVHLACTCPWLAFGIGCDLHICCSFCFQVCASIDKPALPDSSAMLLALATGVEGQYTIGGAQRSSSYSRKISSCRP